MGIGLCRFAVRGRSSGPGNLTNGNLPLVRLDCPMHSRKGSDLSDHPYHHGNLRDAFIEAALALEPEHGPLGISLREVARAVGVTHAAAYHHFASKEALVLAVADEGLTLLLTAIREPVTTHPFTGRMAAFFRIVTVGVEYVRYAVDNPSRFRFMYGTPPLPPGENGSPILARHAEVLQVFADAVSAAHRGKARRPHRGADVGAGTRTGHAHDCRRAGRRASRNHAQAERERAPASRARPRARRHGRIHGGCASAGSSLAAAGNFVKRRRPVRRGAPAGHARCIFRSSAVNRGLVRNAANRNDPPIPYTAPERFSYARSS